MKYTVLLSAAAALLAASSTLFAAPAVQPAASFHFSPAGFRGDSTRMIVEIRIPKGWHIQSDAPLDEFLIPTVVKAEGDGLRFGKAAFPKPVVEDFPVLGGKVALFEGDIEVRVPVARKNAKVSADLLKNAQVTVRYQACNDSQCLPPKEITARYAGG